MSISRQNSSSLTTLDRRSPTLAINFRPFPVRKQPYINMLKLILLLSSLGATGILLFVVPPQSTQDDNRADTDVPTITSTSRRSSEQRFRPRATSADLLAIIKRDFPTQIDVDFGDFELDVVRSNSIPLDRNIPDTRPSVCRDVNYDVSSTSSSCSRVSVVVPFYDESWSMLLRMLHSVVRRTPVHLLHEVILLDDNSGVDYLGRPLERYVAQLSDKIRIVRNARREGLIRSRVTGAKAASGDVIVFLDAHVEVNVDWLPPLLRLLRQNSSVIAVPQIDSIDAQTIDYYAWNYTAHGGLTWTMDYIWKFIPRRLTARLRSAVDAIPTPTTIGCALAVNREFFFKLGAFDDGMLIWGGENLEISIRAWTCAAGVYIAPCSRVGHLFRRVLPYPFPVDVGGTDVKRRNYRRVVDVWFDDYRKYFYAATARQRSRMRRGTPTESRDDMSRDLSARRRLRERLGCRSFSWYLTNVVPEMSIPETQSRYFGQLKNVYGRMCATVDTNSSTISGSDNKLLPVLPCGWYDATQTFSLFENGTLVHSGSHYCLTAATSQRTASLQQCLHHVDHSQLWLFDIDPAMTSPGAQTTSGSDVTTLVTGSLEVGDWSKAIGRLRNVNARNVSACLTQVTWSSSLQAIGMMRCDDVSLSARIFQYWLFTYQFDWTQ